MIKELIKLATHLDKRGLVKEADYLDGIIIKIANPTFKYTVRDGDTPSELALMALGDASRSGEVNEGRPLEIGDVIYLPFLPDRAGTTRTNPATGRTLEIPATGSDTDLDSQIYDMAPGPWHERGGPSELSGSYLTNPAMTDAEYYERYFEIYDRFNLAPNDTHSKLIELSFQQSERGAYAWGSGPDYGGFQSPKHLQAAVSKGRSIGAPDPW